MEDELEEQVAKSLRAQQLKLIFKLNDRSEQIILMNSLLYPKSNQ